MVRNIVADNFYTGTGSSYALKQRMKKIVRAGGNVYEVLAYSGLLQMVGNGLISPESEAKVNDVNTEVWAKGILPVLEVCVDFDEEQTLERVYLYCENTKEYRFLLNKGSVRKGELIFTNESLCELADLGYSCICTIKEHFKWYQECFRDNVKLCCVREEKQKKISKNGFNVVCLILEEAGTYRLERADLYAFETCLAVLQKEEEIRRYVEQAFYVEKISFQDIKECENIMDVLPFGQEVLKLLQPGNEGIFLSEADLRIEDYPMSYRMLAYQMAYMQYYYPQLETAKKEIEEMREYPDALGIELDLHVSRGGRYCSPKEVELLMCRKSEYDFDCFQSVSDLAVATSDMGKSIQRIIEKANGYVDMKNAAVVISLPTELLDADEAEKELDKLHEKLESDPQAALSILLYEELELQGAGTYDCVRKAVELAGLTNVQLVPRTLCVVTAYEHMDNENILVGYEKGLVIDWNLNYLSITVVSRLGERDVNILNQKILRLPQEDFDIKESLRHELEDTMDMSVHMETIFDFFFDETEDVGVTREEKEYRYYMADNVLHQLVRCPYANLILDDCMFADKVERYYLPFFEYEVLSGLWGKIEDAIIEVLEGAQFVSEDITKVYISGELGNYSYIWGKVKEFFERGVKLCIMEDTKYAVVKGATYLAKDSC